ncbi:MAG: hypothetical protein WCO84_09105 [bacterium]
MKTFKEFVNEEGEAMVLAPANQVGTEDKTSVAGEPIKKKGIKLINRKNKVLPGSKVAP